VEKKIKALIKLPKFVPALWIATVLHLHFPLAWPLSAAALHSHCTRIDACAC